MSILTLALIYNSADRSSTSGDSPSAAITAAATSTRKVFLVLSPRLATEAPCQAASATIDEVSFSILSQSPTFTACVKHLSLFIRASASVLECLPRLFGTNTTTTTTTTTKSKSKKGSSSSSSSSSSLDSLSITTAFGAAEDDAFCFSLNATLRKVLPLLATSRLCALSLVRTPIRDQALLNIFECRDLRSLDLSYCFALGDAALERISQLPQLEKLDIRGNRRITSVGIGHLAHHLPHHDDSKNNNNNNITPTLRELTLGHHYGDDNQTSSAALRGFGLFGELFRVTSLRVLRIVFGRLSDEDIASLAKCSQLETLILDDCVGVTAKDLQALAGGGDTRRTQQVSVAGLGKTLQHLVLLRKLVDDSVCSALPFFEKVDHLRLVQRGNFTSEQVSKICQMPSLERVELETFFSVPVVVVTDGDHKTKCHRDQKKNDNADDDDNDADDERTWWKKALKPSPTLLFASIKSSRDEASRMEFSAVDLHPPVILTDDDDDDDSSSSSSDEELHAMVKNRINNSATFAAHKNVIIGYADDDDESPPPVKGRC